MAHVRHVCVYQDSPSHYVSIQLAVLSIGKFDPSWIVHVVLPSPTEEMLVWLAKQPNVRFHEGSPSINGYNVKPKLLLSLMEELGEEVTWIDSDILITRSLEPIIGSVPATHCIVTADPPGEWPDGSRCRTEGWGFPVGRCFPSTINACVVRFGKDHLPLLQAWSDAVESAPYQAAQRMHWSERPVWFLGDSDVLSAVIGSADFSDVKVHILRNGIDIAQCHGADGYSWLQRLRSLFTGLPAMIHAQGGQKPWEESHPLPTFLDVSPYKILAQRYSGQLFSKSWLEPKTRAGSFLRAVFLDSPVLSGLIPAITRAAWLHLRGMKKFLVQHRPLSPPTVANLP